MVLNYVRDHVAVFDFTSSITVVLLLKPIQFFSLKFTKEKKIGSILF